MTEEKPENTGRSRARTALLLVGGLALAGVGYRMWLSPRSAASDTEQAAKPPARPVPVVAEPARTIWPSWKCTAISCPSTRLRTVTVASGVTAPRPSM